MNKSYHKPMLFLLFAVLSISAIHASPALESPTPPQRLVPESMLAQFDTEGSGRAPGNFTVNTTIDSEDANPGNGVCADAGNQCSLRAAIQEANNLDPGSTINIPAGVYTLTVNEFPTLFVTALVISRQMTLIGDGAGETIIDGNLTSTVLAIVDPSVDTIIRRITFRRGSGFPSGADYLVGGVYNAGINTQFRNISIENNYADDIGGFANEMGASAVIENSAIINNLAQTGNTGFGAGGVLNLLSGSLTIRNSTISGNISATQGGGIVVIDSTTTNIANVTITNNTATDIGGGIFAQNATISLRNSILALNNAPTRPDCNGNLNSTGDNLIGNTSGGCVGTPTDLVDINPLLDPLMVSPGANTATHALHELSPAVDSANDTTCLPIDQRGVTRPQREGCDMGAFELEPLPITETPTSTPTSTPTEGPSPTPTRTEIPGLELIANGDFENLDTDGKPDVTPWIVKNESGEKGKCNKDKDGDGIADKIYANTGACAFQFKGEIGESGKIEQNINLINVTIAVGDALNLTFAAQTKDDAAGKAKVIFKYGDDTKTKISVSVGDTSELYQLFAGSGTITSTNIVKSKISFKLTTETGKMYLDSVSLRLVSAGESATPTIESTTPPALLNSRS